MSQVEPLLLWANSGEIVDMIGRATQFVAEGPEIPGKILEAHQEDNLIFFCGAGISMPAGLPAFEGLVEQSYKTLGIPKEPAEEEELKSKNYDRVLGLIERRVRRPSDEKTLLREKVIEILSLDPKTANLSNHKTILELARTSDNKIRLVTTNFDRGFVLVNDAKYPVHTAPNLPSTKKHRWNGIVHLHGLIDESEPFGENLVLTSADFGRAYLTERWASYFMTELFRQFTVVFIGYSVNDPVVRYIVDALAVDRASGERVDRPFAFVGCKREETGKVKLAWEARDIEPIIYDCKEQHRLLYATLRTWAGFHRDGLHGRQRIITECSRVTPNRPFEQDLNVSRLVWAISEPSGAVARRFFSLDPPVEWLEAFEETVVPALALPETQPLLLGGNEYRSSSAPSLDPVPRALTWWLSRHLDKPITRAWVVKNKGRLHPEFRLALREELRQGTCALNEPMRTFWTLVSSEAFYRSSDDTAVYFFLNRLESSDWNLDLRLEFLSLLRPCFEVREPFVIPREATDDGEHEESLDDYARIKVSVVAGGDVGYLLGSLGNSPRFAEALSELAFDLTLVLRQALQMWEMIGKASTEYDESYKSVRSISPHCHDPDLARWTTLVELARRSWEELYMRQPQAARAIVNMWGQIRYPTFRRLELYAAATERPVRTGYGLGLLLAGDRWWLWSPVSIQEALLLLEVLWPDLGESESERLVSAIIEGPPRKMFRKDLSGHEWRDHRDSMIWERLTQLHQVRSLTGSGLETLQRLEKEHPEWGVAKNEQHPAPKRIQETVWIPASERQSEGVFLQMPRDEIVKMVASGGDPKKYGIEFADLLTRRVSRGVTAIVELARRQFWQEQFWSNAITGLPAKIHGRGIWRCLATAIGQMPDRLLQTTANALSFRIQESARTVPADSEAAFWTVWDRLMQTADSAHDLPTGSVRGLNQAINNVAGELTTALLERLWATKPTGRQGLPNRIKTRATRIVQGGSIAAILGRIILASRLHGLYSVDPDWTAGHLLRYFKWDHPEAKWMWEGYLWNPRISPSLFSLLKEDFLETLRRSDRLGESEAQVCNLFAVICLDARESMSDNEIGSGLREISPKGRRDVARTFSQFLKEAPENAAALWRNRVGPLITDVWPKEARYLEPESSFSLAQAAIESGEEFPHAVETILPLLTHVDRASLLASKLYDAGHATKFPRPSLFLLDRVTGEGEIWIHPKFRDALTEIAKAWPEAKNEAAYRRLDEYLMRLGY